MKVYFVKIGSSIVLTVLLCFLLFKSYSFLCLSVNLLILIKVKYQMNLE